MGEYLRCFRDSRTVHAICEDYRAAATLDEANRREERRITCPVLALWGSRGNLEEWYAVLDIWRSWANEVRGRALECGHYLPEEAPGKTYSELRAIFELGAPSQSASL